MDDKTTGEPTKLWEAELDSDGLGEKGMEKYRLQTRAWARKNDERGQEKKCTRQGQPEDSKCLNDSEDGHECDTGKASK